jgi:excisionase family DNA binding protein
MQQYTNTDGSMQDSAGSKLLLTIPEAARQLNCCERKVWQWISKGRLATVKLDRSRRIVASSLAAFISHHAA